MRLHVSTRSLLISGLALLAVVILIWQESSISVGSAPGSLFSQPEGYYEAPIRLALHAPSPDVDIIYTLDGQVPVPETAVLYTKPLQLATGATVIRARLLWPDGEMGPVENASYWVAVDSSLPLMSLVVDPDDLWHPEQGIYANPVQRGIDWERPVDITYVDQNRTSGFHVAAGLRIHGGFTRTYDKKSFRLYFRQSYGLGRLAYPLFGEETADLLGTAVSFNRLVLHNGGQDSSQLTKNWALMRSQLVATLAQEMDGYAVQSRAVLLFVNGDLWGIYQVRERIDDDFFADRYGLEAIDYLDTPHLPETQAPVLGDRLHWDHLVNFLETHDLSDPAAYAYVQTQVDIENFIDYTLLQMYSANYDWPHHNVNQFRPRVQGGRWRWIFWDNDFGFHLDANSQADLNMFELTLERNQSIAVYQQGVLLLRKLLQNETFRALFLRRATDLLNTTLSPDHVNQHVETLANELQADIGYEVGRWSSDSEWANNVRLIQAFAAERPAFMRQHLAQQFNLSGTAELSFQPPGDGQGSVAVNGDLLAALPWKGTYFQGTTVRITAVPQPGYRFISWEEIEGDADLDLPVTTDQVLTPRFAPLAGGEPGPGAVVISAYHNDDSGEVMGDWFELRTVRPIDLRGWRLTDNDSRTATDEGSLILAADPALARIPAGTVLRIVATKHVENDRRFPEDDLDSRDGHMLLYVGNGRIDAETDPWFNLGPNDNLALLAPGPTSDFADDIGIAYVNQGNGRPAAEFGILPDGVRPWISTEESPPSLSAWSFAFLLAGLIVLPFGLFRVHRRKQPTSH